MDYFLEVWLRGFAKDYLKSISTKDKESYHPHITLIRPFQILTNEEDVKEKITSFCKNILPISFSLEGVETFEEDIYYIPVINCDKLFQFDNSLEQLLSKDVQFAEKLNNKKILHATINANTPILPCPKIDQYMLRLTGIKNKKIWFSYDFITKEVLNREKSLDKTIWHKTVSQFTEKYGLLPTRQGYQTIR
jgi:hypothetical protein